MPHDRLKMGDKFKKESEIELQKLKSLIKVSPKYIFCKRHGFNVRVCRLTNCDHYPCT